MPRLGDFIIDYRGNGGCGIVFEVTKTGLKYGDPNEPQIPVAISAVTVVPIISYGYYSIYIAHCP